jgi:hypothetical protein
MPPKASAIPKGKAPKRQLIVSPALEEEVGPLGPIDNQLSLAETET